MTEFSKGDILLTKRIGKDWGSMAQLPDGCPVVVNHVAKDEDRNVLWYDLRVALNLTGSRVYPNQVRPFPADLSIEDAERRIMEGLYGRKAEKRMKELYAIYHRLVDKGKIPAVDEAMIVREAAPTVGPKP